MKSHFGGTGDMQPIEVIITKQPKPNPQATTGDPIERTEITVCWPGEPDATDIRKFEDQLPQHLDDATHWENFNPDDWDA